MKGRLDFAASRAAAAAEEVRRAGVQARDVGVNLPALERAIALVRESIQTIDEVRRSL